MIRELAADAVIAGFGAAVVATLYPVGAAYRAACRAASRAGYAYRWAVFLAADAATRIRRAGRRAGPVGDPPGPDAGFDPPPTDQQEEDTCHADLERP